MSLGYRIGYLNNQDQKLKNRILHYLIPASQKKVPMDSKFSQIVMIQKKSNDLNKIKNYRPISIIDCLARPFERILLKTPANSSSRKNIIIKMQSGSRNSRQTLSQKGKEEFNKGGKTISLFFTIASALTESGTTV